MKKAATDMKYAKKVVAWINTHDGSEAEIDGNTLIILSDAVYKDEIVIDRYDLDIDANGMVDFEKVRAWLGY